MRALTGVVVILLAACGTDPTTGGDDEPAGHAIHMPSPSIFPMILALGLPVMGYGFVFKNWWLLGVGVAILMFGITAWAYEPPTEEEGAH